MAFLKKRKKMSGIVKRWVKTDLILLVALITVAVFAVGIFINEYYINSMKVELISRANAASGYLSEYMTTNYLTFYNNAQKIVDDFSERDKLEMQVIDSYGRVIVSSSGLGSGITPGTSDVKNCFSARGVISYLGTDSLTNERVMSVSAPVISGESDEIMGAVRYISSAKLLTHQLNVFTLILAGVYIAFVGTVLISNLFFLRTIVNPILQITNLVQKISAGQYGTTLDVEFNDEIGTLCGTINDMSREILRMEKMKNDFISTVSHELKTPLTSIGGWAETAAHDLEDKEVVNQGLAIVIRETHRLSQMVEELLDFSRLEGSTFKLNTATFDICEIVRDSLFTYREMLNQSGMTVNIDDRLYDEISVSGDYDRLKQVFLNIIDNAVKYGSEGKKLSVNVSTEKNTCSVVLKDYGAGIPEKELPFVKDKFFKGSSKGRGTGIGLSVCNELVELHGGRLDVLSEYGKGTSVIVTLPIKE